ncbi:MAG: hypothetical protein OWV35_01390, partial [Firmicutes bacterium]|nr:hypothetical protein [Bacillota bacterium]
MKADEPIRRLLAWTLSGLLAIPFLLWPPPARAASPAFPPFTLTAAVADPGTPLTAVYDPALGLLLTGDGNGNTAVWTPTAGTLTPAAVWMETPAPAGTLPVPATGPHGRHLYLAAGGVVEEATLPAGAPAPLFALPGAAYVTPGPRGQHVYALGQSGSTLTVAAFAPGSGGPVTVTLTGTATAPAAAVYTPSGTRLYVPLAQGRIAVLTFADGSWQTAPALTANSTPLALAVTPQGTLFANTGAALESWVYGRSAPITLPLPAAAVALAANPTSLWTTAGTVYVTADDGQGGGLLLSGPLQGPLTVAATGLAADAGGDGSATGWWVLAPAGLLRSGPAGLTRLGWGVAPVDADLAGDDLLAAGPAGRHLYLACQAGVARYNLLRASWTAGLAGALAAPPAALALNGADGRLAAAGGGQVLEFPLPGGTPVPAWTAPPGSTVTGLAVTGSTLLAAYDPAGAGSLTALGPQPLWSTALPDPAGVTVAGPIAVAASAGRLLPVSLASGTPGSPFGSSAGGNVATLAAGGTTWILTDTGNGVAAFAATSGSPQATLPVPTVLPEGQSTPPGLYGIAPGPHGQHLYLAAANGILVYALPGLSLSAASLTPAAGSPDPVTATLTRPDGRPWPGVMVDFGA